MRTTDWNYDFSALPRWDDRERIPYVFDEFYELPQSDTLCCLYSVEEVSMMNYVGFLAIFRSKEKPELVLNVTDFSFCINFSASADGNLLFLQPSIHLPDKGRTVRPVLLLDIKNNRFSYLRTDNYSPAYQVMQKSPHVFEVEADAQHRNSIPRLAALHGKKIQTHWLRWYGMDKLSALPRMIL